MRTKPRLFTKEEVLGMRSKYKYFEYTLKTIAQEYNTSHQNIHRIVNNKIYRDIK